MKITGYWYYSYVFIVCAAFVLLLWKHHRDDTGHKPLVLSPLYWPTDSLSPRSGDGNGGGVSFGGDIAAAQGGGVSRPTPFSVKPEEDEDGNTFCPFGYDKHLAVGNFTCTATPDLSTTGATATGAKPKAKPASPSYLTYKVSDGYAVHCKGLSYAYDGAWFEPPLKKDAESYCKVWRFLSKEQSGPSALTHFLAAPGLGIPKSSTDDFPKKHAMEHKEGYTLWGDVQVISGIYVAPLPIECPDYASCI